MLQDDYPKTVRAKDGSTITVRPMIPNDRDGLMAFFQSLPEADRMFLKHDVTQPEVIDRWFSGLNYDQLIPILALYGDRIIADGTLHLNPQGWSRHMAEIRLVVAADWQNRGIGTHVARELVGLAQQRGVAKIEVQVVEDALGAIAMFQKLGFAVDCVRSQYVLDLKGQYRDLVVMVNDVDALWRQMEDMIQDTIADHTGEPM